MYKLFTYLSKPIFNHSISEIFQYSSQNTFYCIYCFKYVCITFPQAQKQIINIDNNDKVVTYIVLQKYIILL